MRHHRSARTGTYRGPHGGPDVTSAVVYRRRRTVLLLAVTVAVSALAWSLLPGGHSRPATARAATAAAHPQPRVHPHAAAAGLLAPGSDPAALPGPLLIADRGNNRLIIVDPHGRIVWQFPRPGDLAPGQTFTVPDDAFFTPDGRSIIATQEDDFVVTLIDVATHRITWRYGVPGVSGSAPNHLFNPDDAVVLPTGQVLVADIKNCRLVVIPKGGHAPQQTYGAPYHCTHAPPRHFASPNGAFPLPNGHFLVTEIGHDWVDEVGLDGTVAWSAHPPGVRYPSDTNEVAPNVYLTADYSRPGQLVEFDRTGRLLWRYAPGGLAVLNKPSLAEPLPNGDIVANDDLNHRVIIVDPRTNKIVWQYGHTGIPGSAPGYLHQPDGLDLAPPRSLLIRHAATTR